MTFRFNLIQRFVFLNLAWLIGMGLYFGYWFSDEMIDTVSRLQSTELFGSLHPELNQRFSLAYFDSGPDEQAAKNERIQMISDQLSGSMSPSEYPLQILWDRKGVLWSNRRDLIGKPIPEDPLLKEGMAGYGRAHLESGMSKILWMWNALAHEDRIINETSSTSYLRILIPISFPKEGM